MQTKLRKISLAQRKSSLTNTKRVEKNILNSRQRKAFRVSANTLGTTRRFQNLKLLENYLKRNLALKEFFSKSTTTRFAAKIPQIIIVDKKGLKIVERVYPCVSVLDILSNTAKTDSRYYKFYQRMLKRKELSEDIAKSFVENAEKDLWRVLHLQKIPYDPARSNILIEDIDPTTKKVSFIIVDHGGSICE